MSTTEYTLDELIERTGFSKRQIRFYITKKLVEGAGDSRGPAAAYSEETLRRLLAIARLKDHRIEPTGRRMTLEEIGLALETLGPDGIDALTTGTAVLRALETEPADDRMAMRKRTEPPAASSAADYLAALRRIRNEPGEQARRSAVPDVHASRAERLPEPMRSMTYWSDATDPADDLRDTLTALQRLLAELGKDARHTTTGDAEQWRRLRGDLLEIHVRQPANHHTRLRLAGLARALADLLTSGEDQ